MKHNDLPVLETHTPETFLDWALENVDPADDGSMLAASEHLRALNRNKDFVRASIAEELRFLATNETPKARSAQLTIHAKRFGKNGSFMVRTVIWTSTKSISERAKIMQDRALSYALAHDHNFSLLTIGHNGPGYRTDIYEYDREKVVGYIGEEVTLKFKETTQLCEDKILFFSPLRDVHVQHPPEDVSISLNLIGMKPGNNLAMQYEFDIEQRKISALVRGNSVEQMLGTFDIVDNMGSCESVIEWLAHIAKNHPSDQMRCRAHVSLSKQPAWDVNESGRIGMQDVSPLVRRSVALLLEGRPG